MASKKVYVFEVKFKAAVFAKNKDEAEGMVCNMNLPNYMIDSQESDLLDVLRSKKEFFDYYSDKSFPG